MKTLGLVRKLDQLGRITLPIELRRTLGVEEKDPLEIFVDEDRIILKKYVPAGPCDDAHQVTFIKGKFVCKNCGKSFSEEV